MDAEHRQITPAHRAFAILGGLLLLALGFLVLASPLIAPPWGVVVLWLAWIASATWSVRSWRQRVFGPLVAGGVMAVFWTIFLTFGDLVLGWSA